MANRLRPKPLNKTDKLQKPLRFCSLFIIMFIILKRRVCAGVKEMTRLTFIADLHHYSETLGTTGRQYALRSGSDQKCLAETGAIIDAAFAKIAQSDTQAVMLIGDVTNDGERVSHMELLEKLRTLQQRKPVYTVTATHDWCCDGNPRRFCGNSVSDDVPTCTSEELGRLYAPFGPEQALAVYTTHLGTQSYTVDIGDDVRLLALIDDQNGRGRAGFTEEHFQWIETQLHRAAKAGRVLIAMEHHLLLPSVHPLFTGGCCVGEREEVVRRLMRAGLRYVFVGHSHMQFVSRFTDEAGRTLTQVNVGSLCGYPAPICRVTVANGRVRFFTEHLQSFVWKGQAVPAQSYLAAHAFQMIDRLLQSPNQNEFTDRLTALQLPGEKFGALYPLVRPLLCFVRTATLGQCARVLRPLGFLKGVPESCVRECQSVRLLPLVYRIFLNLFDGAEYPFLRGGAQYRLVMAFMASLEKRVPALCGLTDAADVLLCGGRWPADSGDIT